MLTADLEFGQEVVKVGDVEKTVDICELADSYYARLKDVPKDLDQLAEMKANGAALNAALATFGLPEIKSPAAALKFGEDILNRALDCKKKALGIIDGEELED